MASRRGAVDGPRPPVATSSTAPTESVPSRSSPPSRTCMPAYGGTAGSRKSRSSSRGQPAPSTDGNFTDQAADHGLQIRAQDGTRPPPQATPTPLRWSAHQRNGDGFASTASPMRRRQSQERRLGFPETRAEHHGTDRSQSHSISARTSALTGRLAAAESARSDDLESPAGSPAHFGQGWYAIRCVLSGGHEPPVERSRRELPRLCQIWCSMAAAFMSLRLFVTPPPFGQLHCQTPHLPCQEPRRRSSPMEN
jgi:hypothetical protein